MDILAASTLLDPAAFTMIDETPSDSDAPPSGRHLAHFELEEVIGRGGMGVVYRGRDTRLDRPVAVKLLPEAFETDPERRARFLREARAAARVNHPNIATLYEVGEAEWTPEGGPPRPVIYLAMEYVEGRDLGGELVRREGGGDEEDRTGLELGRALDYAVQIAGALAAAHEKGVVHRDLKPQNVRITPEGRVKILDFGLAKLIQEGSRVADMEEAFRTTQGAIVGTAPYMAPEQLHDSDSVDARSDLFSFGVVLYQMLTGELPYEATRLVDYVKALGKQTPKPLSQVNPTVPPELQEVVSRLLEPEPRNRYASAVEVREDLTAIARRTDAGLVELPRRDSLISEMFEPLKRPWAGWLLAVLFLAVLAGGLWWNQRASQPATVAAEPVKTVQLPPFENLAGGEHAAVCKGLRLALANEFQEVPVVVQTEGDAAGARFRLDGSCLRLSDERVSVLLNLVDTESGVQLWSRQFDGGPGRVLPEMVWRSAEALGVVVSPRVRERLDHNPYPAAETLTHYFRGLERQDRFEDEAALEQAVAEFELALRREPEFAHAWVGKSEALRRLARRRGDAEMKQEAEGAVRRAVELDPELPGARLALAKLLRDEGRFEEARAEIEELLELQPRNPEFYLQKAIVQYRAGDAEKASLVLQAGLKRSGLPPSNVGRYWNQLGAYLMERADFDSAREAFGKALGTASQSIALGNLMGLEIRAGHRPEAVEYFEAMPLQDRTWKNFLNLGTAFFFAGEYSKAVELYEGAVALQPTEPMTHANWGDAKWMMGDRESAREAYREAAELITEKLAVSPNNRQLMIRESLYLAKSGACPSALAHLDRLRASGEGSPSDQLYFAKITASCGENKEAAQLVRGLVTEGKYTREQLCGELELQEVCALLAEVL